MCFFLMSTSAYIRSQFLKCWHFIYKYTHYNIIIIFLLFNFNFFKWQNFIHTNIFLHYLHFYLGRRLILNIIDSKFQMLIIYPIHNKIFMFYSYVLPSFITNNKYLLINLFKIYRKNRPQFWVSIKKFSSL